MRKFQLIVIACAREELELSNAICNRKNHVEMCTGQADPGQKHRTSIDELTCKHIINDIIIRRLKVGCLSVGMTALPTGEVTNGVRLRAIIIMESVKCTKLEKKETSMPKNRRGTNDHFSTWAIQMSTSSGRVAACLCRQHYLSTCDHSWSRECRKESIVQHVQCPRANAKGPAEQAQLHCVGVLSKGRQRGALRPARDQADMNCAVHYVTLTRKRWLLLRDALLGLPLQSPT